MVNGNGQWMVIGHLNKRPHTSVSAKSAYARLSPSSENFHRHTTARPASLKVSTNALFMSKEIVDHVWDTVEEHRNEKYASKPLDG